MKIPIETRKCTDTRTRKRRRIEEVEEEQEETHQGAREEARVLQRVAELRRRGLWAPDEGRGMAALTQPGRPEPAAQKAHWSFVLEEMSWLAGVIRQDANQILISQPNLLFLSGKRPR